SASVTAWRREDRPFRETALAAAAAIFPAARARSTLRPPPCRAATPTPTRPAPSPPSPPRSLRRWTPNPSPSARTPPASAAPTPSVETLLHAYLPYRYVDHTHADAVLALADQPDAERICRETFGAGLVWVPYVMPGFALAKRTADAHDAAVKEGRTPTVI